MLTRQLLQPMQTLCKTERQESLPLFGLITHRPAVALGCRIHQLNAEVGREVLRAGLIQGRAPPLSAVPPVRRSAGP